MYKKEIITRVEMKMCGSSALSLLQNLLYVIKTYVVFSKFLNSFDLYSKMCINDERFSCLRTRVFQW